MPKLEKPPDHFVLLALKAGLEASQLILSVNPADLFVIRAEFFLGIGCT